MVYDMEQKKAIELYDELIAAKKVVESMHYLSVLLLDAYEANGDDNGQSVIFMYYTYSNLMLKGLGGCVGKIDEYLKELNKNK